VALHIAEAEDEDDREWTGLARSAEDRTDGDVSYVLSTLPLVDSTRYCPTV